MAEPFSLNKLPSGIAWEGLIVVAFDPAIVRVKGGLGVVRRLKLAAERLEPVVAR